MDMAKIINAVVSFAVTAAISIISFFLKRTISTVDRCDQELKTKVSQEELEAVKSDLSGRLDKLARDIETVKADYITREDFYREQAKTDRKLDRIYDILLEIKGGRTNG